ncbi:MAG: hypothetical protein ABSE99_10740 [Terracidiphilus sp.]|jgi:hypothetical protein
MEDQEPESEAIIDPVKPKDLLYHYTDQRGLLGILGSQNIWATHIRYLNDSSEYKLGLDIVKREVSQIKVDPSPDLTFEGFPDGAEFREGPTPSDDSGFRGVGQNVCIRCVVL